MDYTVKIGGAAGHGLQTIGDALAKVFTRSGYYVFSHQDYESRIRGGHNFYQIRFSDRPIMSSRERIDIIIALDKETVLYHAAELYEWGQILYDSLTLKETHDGPQFFDIPFESLATEHGGSKLMGNTVATGAVLGMIGMDTDVLFDVIRDSFKKKGDEVVQANINAASAGYKYAKIHCARCSFVLAPLAKPKMLISGAEAIALGAIASGLKFYAAYPMTPATGIMNYIAGHAAGFGIIVEQAEDEIAAINMALGASFGGVRAMTGTSGGGFALMVEGLSLAAMTETPVVIVLGQRPGPATGLPTRTEQGDLQFALYAAHGEFPRVILAPGTPEQAFHATNKAFDLAEKYQIPVILLFDQYLGDCQWTYDAFDLTRTVYRDYRLRGETFAGIKDYWRHRYTETGVSPLGVPGHSRHVVVTDSDEHDEKGHIVEDAETRKKMVNKRLFGKMPLIQREIAPPLLYGSEKARVVLACWGSSYGLVKEAVDTLSIDHEIAMLNFGEIFPFPSTEQMDYLKILSRAQITICIENNATGQFARLMRAETGYTFTKSINRFDGRPFMLEELTGEINGFLGRV
ncbi:MAG: 2-oxoacid:acceptor oxidoreductase subunit alpha [Dissulfurispiraceae bacterium]